tara:strand:- start:405352 stop:405819 length:468 start_codon:yes stop_codon:yes gene_type:complete
MKEKPSLLDKIRPCLDRVLMLAVIGLLLGEVYMSRGATGVRAQSGIGLPEQANAAGNLLIAGRSSGTDFGTDDGLGVMRVDRTAFARQLAISILVDHEHEITDQRVSFLRDQSRSGTAINQFADSFGQAIERGLLKFELPEENRVVRTERPASIK